MSDKITYHLSNLLTEFREILTAEFSTLLQKSLIQKQISTDYSTEYLTIDQLASNFNISKSHINKLRKKHKDFPVLQINGSVRFSYFKVEAFLIELAENPR